MVRPSRQAAVIALSLLGGGVLVWHGALASGDRVLEAGFWFEPISFDAPALGGPLSAGDLETIESIARAELARAFAGLRIRFSSRRDARYRVRVVQELYDPRFRRRVGVAGASRAITGFGGSGAVSFSFVAHGAIGHAPPGAGRSALIVGIGTGVGRTAVHELTHELLPKAPIHDSTSIDSYEYASAARREQYYGHMHWDLAGPMLVKRLGRTPQK